MKSILICLSAAASTGPSYAQLRADQPPVIRAETAASTVEAVDHVDRLKLALVAAGRPRIVLYWNTLLSPGTRSTAMEIQTTQTKKSNVSDDSEESTSGSAGDARVANSLDETNSQSTVQHFKEFRHGSRRMLQLVGSETNQMKNAFQQEFSRAGIDLLDRRLILRQSDALSSETGVDPLVEEMRGLAESADWVIQVLFVEDSKAALSFGVDLQIYDVKTGAILHSLYSRQQHAPARPGRWRAGKSGFEYVNPGLRMLSPSEMGTQLARHVAQQIGKD